MPQLEAEEFARVARLIDELDEAKGVYTAGANFIRDQVARKKEYGERMFLSPKQVKWIEDLHAEFVGTAEKNDTGGVEELDERFRDDPDY